MYTLDPIHPVYSSVIELIAVYPQITTAELYEHLTKKQKIALSLPQLYRIITRMIDSQIIIKVHGKLTLNLMWISYIEFIAGRAKRIIQHNDEFPLMEGEKKMYQAGSMFDLEAIWNHILVSLYRLLQEKEIYKYYSHAWWQIGRNAEEINFYKQLKERGIQSHWVFGADSFLDRKGAAHINQVFDSVLTKEPPFPKDGYNMNVYGEYIVECILPEKISKRLSYFFEHVRTEKAFDEDLFIDIFSMNAPCKITVWRNKKQANILRQKLAAHF
jgi:hypothetical protein